MYFLELGKIPTFKEYTRAKDRPLKLSAIKNVFRTYDVAVKTVRKLRPDVIEELEKPVAPKVAPKAAPKAAPNAAPKVAPKPAPKPAPKVASKKEK